MSPSFAASQRTAILCGLFLAAVACRAAAAGPAAPRSYTSLLRRLEEAERRIEQLETHTPRATGDSPAENAEFGWSGARETTGTGQQKAGELSHAYSAGSQTGSFSARLARLERAWESASRTAIRDDYVPPSEPTFELGGRIHFDHWAFPNVSDGIGFFENPDTGVDPEDRFAFRRIRLEFGGDVFETMRWRMQIDFNEPGTPQYKDVFIGFTELPYNQQLLIGNQKRPIGLDQLNSSRFNVFTERPLVVEAFNEDARRIGIAMYGYSDDEVYNWRYGVYTLENTTSSGAYIGDSLQMSANARLASSPWYDEASGGRGYFHWAIAGVLARPDGDVDPRDSNLNEARFRTRPEARSSSRWINTGRIAGAEWYEILALESILNVGPLQITGEYMTNWLQRDSTTPGTGPDLFFHGAYIYVAYFLTGEHMPLDRTDGTLDRARPFQNFFFVERCRGGHGVGWGAWQVAARYSYLDLTDEDIRGGLEHDVTFGLNWYWTSHSKLQFNLIYGDIEQHEPVGGFADGNFLTVGTRFMADF